MKNFNEKKKEAKAVFFKNHNFIDCADFMYDFLNDKLIPCDVKRSSNGACVSFREYATVFDTAELFALIEEEYSYDGTKECYSKFVDRVEKIFDTWFETFYDNVKNSEYDITCVGTRIACEYECMEY